MIVLSSTDFFKINLDIISLSNMLVDYEICWLKYSYQNKVFWPPCRVVATD